MKDTDTAQGYPVKFRKYHSLGTMREMRDDENYPGEEVIVSFLVMFMFLGSMGGAKNSE